MLSINFSRTSSIRSDNDSPLFLYFQLLVIMIVVLTGAALVLGASRCSPKWRLNRNSTQVLQRIQRMCLEEKGYLIVKNQVGMSGDSHTHTSTGTEHTTYCPWRWKVDDNPDRIPRFLVYADLDCAYPDCDIYCREVYYTHRTLVLQRNKTTGVTWWSWIPETKKVAYVYDI